MLPDSLKNNLSKVLPYLIGISIPSVVIGPAVMGIVLGVSTVLLFCYPKQEKMFSFVKKSFSSPLTITLIIMLVFWFTSSMLSIDPLRSLEKWLRTIVLIIFSLFIYGRFAEEEHDRVIAIKTMVISTALVAILLGILMVGQKLYYQQIILFGNWINWSRDSFSLCLFMHCDLSRYKDFSQVLMCFLPIVIFSFKAESKRFRWLILSSIPFIIWIALYTETKSAALAAICGIMFLAIWLLIKKIKEKYAPTLILLLLTSLVFSTISFIKLLPQDVELKNNPNGIREYNIPFNIIGEHRQIIWSFSYDRFLQRPWLGFGPDVSGDIP
ncbi:MAG TPA: hypothetical protein DCG52_03015, partial [Alphaproteobacteria bacterium]|nr:hypothetical protein [Alphaproteobacteria bacterium]